MKHEIHKLADLHLVIHDATSDLEDVRSLSLTPTHKDDFRRLARKAQEVADSAQQIADWSRSRALEDEVKSRIATIKNKLTPAFQLVANLDPEPTPSNDDPVDSLQGLKEAIKILDLMWQDL